MATAPKHGELIDGACCFCGSSMTAKYGHEATCSACNTTIPQFNYFVFNVLVPYPKVPSSADLINRHHGDGAQEGVGRRYDPRG